MAGDSLRIADQEARHPGGRVSTVVVLGSYAPSLINFRGPLISTLIAKGRRVVAAAPDIDPETAAALSAIGAEPRSLKLSNASLSPLAMARSYLELRRLLRRERPDILFSYTIKPVILGALAGRSERVPKIVSLITGLGFAFLGGRDSMVGKLVGILAQGLYRWALRCSDLVLFQNKDDEALFRRRILTKGAATAVVDGSGVDIDHFAMPPPAARPSFLMIARLLKSKGINEYVAAAKRLKAEHPQARFALAGYIDPSPDSIGQRELDQMIGEDIHFYGRLDDVRPALAACSVYVLPSYREGTPRSVLEAMAAGRAIVTTDAPGCRETVVDGVNGHSVPVRDAEALYLAMKRFVEEPELAVSMGAQSRQLAERRYDVRKVNSDILRHIGI